MWITPLSYPGTMAALMTVQHKQFCYGNILARIGTRDSVRSPQYGLVHGMQLNDADWLSIILARISELFDIQWND